jgi:hypothetical protein
MHWHGAEFPYFGLSWSLSSGWKTYLVRAASGAAAPAIYVTRGKTIHNVTPVSNWQTKLLALWVTFHSKDVKDKRATMKDALNPPLNFIVWRTLKNECKLWRIIFIHFSKGAAVTLLCQIKTSNSEGHILHLLEIINRFVITHVQSHHRRGRILSSPSILLNSIYVWGRQCLLWKYSANYW